MHAAGIEEEHAIYGFGPSHVRVAVDDRISFREPPFQGRRQPSMWSEVAEAQGPGKRVRFLQPAPSVAVNKPDPLSSDPALPRLRHLSYPTTRLPPHAFTC